MTDESVFAAAWAGRAEHLPSTAARHWAYARAWLQRAMSPGSAPA